MGELCRRDLMLALAAAMPPSAEVYCGTLERGGVIRLSWSNDDLPAQSFRDREPSSCP
jgi:hypothetical protein